MSERTKGYFSLYILCMLYNKLTFYVCCTSIYLIFNVRYIYLKFYVCSKTCWHSMYYVEHLAAFLCTLYICTSQPNAAQLGVCLFKDWSRTWCYRGTIKCNMMRLVTMWCYDIMIMNNYDWKLIVEIDRKLFWQSKYVQMCTCVTWLRHQDLLRFVMITTITLWLRLRPQSCCKSW